MEWFALRPWILDSMQADGMQLFPALIAEATIATMPTQ
jgi:hypothetical protein